MSRSQGHSVDVALATLLDALAPVLIPLDITPSRLARIARASFVKACAKQAQTKTSGRPHLARIAALTALSRVEVKRIVASNFDPGTPDSESSPRALRVLSNWCNSAAYTRGGKPLSLRIAGKAPSFTSLCKAYSGDIPYKVILDELQRRKCIVVFRKKNRVSVANSIRKSARNSRGELALAFAVSFIRDALQDDLVLVRRSERVATSGEFPDSYVEGAVVGRLTDLLDQLPDLYVRRNNTKRNMLTVFTLVSKNQKKR
jgi:Family of unknown function (DUF6502)